ncbi:MAG: 1-(5-phosphoribosyl)-5-[Firmicutes bacterium]|nr:1-(5-phosphoribosyl)-5-[(5-phosphoribosylamino)methylideneamino]imidazole-4-carboxamide isomerase [Bacillota bacterium]
MIILPAIDIYEGKAVRLLKGDYDKLTVYSERPEEIGLEFARCGAEWVHIVDLEGARSGETPNLPVITGIIEKCGLKAEVGGGIRSMAVIEKYLDAGVSRVVLGTAAVKDPQLLDEAVKRFGERVAVGVDIKNNYVAIKGWTENSDLKAMDFCRQLQDRGVSTIVCTDISRDGAMKGTNVALYKKMSKALKLNIVASGGVSSEEDVKALREAGLYGAIIGKAYYTGAIDLKKILEDR